MVAKKAKKKIRSLKSRRARTVKPQPYKAKKIKKASVKKAQSSEEVQPFKVNPQNQTAQTRIKIVGVGGGGNSIVSEIARLSKGFQWGKNFRKVDFLAINTDVQALSRVSKYCKTLKIGQGLTKGLGCGMDSGLGRRAALASREEIRKCLEGADFCLLLVCLGGGTGSGVAPLVAEIANSLKMISLGIFALPFKFEGEKKATIARNSLKKMKPDLNAVSIIPNERIFQIVDKTTPLKIALSAINQRLTFTLTGFMNMIYSAGLINLDWADFKTILDGRGKRCYLNRVENSDESSAQAAARGVVRNPLNDYGLEGADRVLFNIEGDKSLKMQEVAEISQFIFNFNKKAKIIFGVSLAEASPKNSGEGNRVGITLLATGKEKGSGKSSIALKTKRFSSSSVSRKKKKSVVRSRRVKSVVPKKKIALRPKREKSSANPQSVIAPPKNKKAKRGILMFPLRRRKKQVSGRKSAVNSGRKSSVPAQITVPTELGIESSLDDKPKTENHSRPKTIRKNGLAIKKEIEKAEKEILAAEKKWDPPAFLRQNK